MSPVNPCKSLKAAVLVETLFAIPGLRGRLKVTEDATPADRPRSVHFPEGLGFRNRESVAPPGNDLGGLRHQPRFCRRSDRRGLPSSIFPEAGRETGGLPRKNTKHGTPRLRVLGALIIERRHRPCRKTRAPNTSDGACRVRHSPSGRPPTNGVVAVNADTGQRSASALATESLPAP